MAGNQPSAHNANAGAFYPDKLPLDTDNDLVLINDSITPSVGTIATRTESDRQTKKSMPAALPLSTAN